jgi:hypothetical protein
MHTTLSQSITLTPPGARRIRRNGLPPLLVFSGCKTLWLQVSISQVYLRLLGVGSWNDSTYDGYLSELSARGSAMYCFLSRYRAILLPLTAFEFIARKAVGWYIVIPSCVCFCHSWHTILTTGTFKPAPLRSIRLISFQAICRGKYTPQAVSQVRL